MGLARDMGRVLMAGAERSRETDEALQRWLLVARELETEPSYECHPSNLHSEATLATVRHLKDERDMLRRQVAELQYELEDCMGRLNGVGPDTPVVENANGGRQSDLPYRMDLLPPQAILDVAAVLKTGAEKYGEDNWHAIGVRSHINHAMTHFMAYLAGDLSDEHLAHAATRALMALEIFHHDNDQYTTMEAL